MQSNLALSLDNVKNLDFQAWTVRRAVLTSDLTPTQRLVGLVLLEHTDAAGACWPSLATISKETGLGKSTVCEAVAALEAARWLTRTRRSTPSGDPTSTLYRFAPRAAPEPRKTPVRPVVGVVRQPDTPCPPAGHDPIRGTTHKDPDPDRVYAQPPEPERTGPERSREGRAKALALAPRPPTTTTTSPRPATTTAPSARPRPVLATPPVLAPPTTKIPCAPIRVTVPNARKILEGARTLLAVLQAPTNVARATSENLTSAAKRGAANSGAGA